MTTELVLHYTVPPEAVEHFVETGVRLGYRGNIDTAKGKQEACQHALDVALDHAVLTMTAPKKVAKKKRA